MKNAHRVAELDFADDGGLKAAQASAEMAAASRVVATTRAFR